MRFPKFLLCSLIALLAACASKGAPGAPTTSRSVLSSEEMVRAGYPDVFTTVQSLRPHWLQKRGQTSLRRGEIIKVYLDGSLLGGVEDLKTITTRSIQTIRFLDGIEASQRWGLDHGAGAIVVSTRKI